jgi:hypothetical protein
MTRMVKKVVPFKKPKGSLQYLQKSAFESYFELVGTVHKITCPFAMIHFKLYSLFCAHVSQA